MSKLCTCWHKCKGGKEIHPSTYAHHAKWRPSPLFVAYLEKEKVKYDSGMYGCPLLKVDASVGKIYQRFKEIKKRENETEEERKIRYREVKRISSHRWYERHKKHMSEYSKRWREKNKDRIKERLEKKKEEEKEEKAKKKEEKKRAKEKKKKERASRLEKGKKREWDDSDAEDNELEDEKLWGTMTDNDDEFVPTKRRKLQHKDEDSDKENATSSVTRRESGSEKKKKRVTSARKMAATKRIVPESSSSPPPPETRQINSRTASLTSAPVQSILITSLKTGNVPPPDDLLKKERHIRWADTSTRKSSPPGTTQRSLLLSRSCGPAPDEENAKPQEIKPDDENEVGESNDEDKFKRKKKLMENSIKAEDMETNLDEISSLSSFNSEDDIPSYNVIDSDSSVSIEDDTETVV